MTDKCLCTPASVQLSSVNLRAICSLRLVIPSVPAARCRHYLKMQCFMCVTYLLVLRGAGEAAPAQRSLFRDVLQSLYDHAHALAPRAPHDLPPVQQTDNHLPITDYYPVQPRRNDRLEEPPLTYRLPKSLSLNDTDVIASDKEEIVVFIDTTKEPKMTTSRPKRQKRPKPVNNKLKQNEVEEEVGEKPDSTLTNTMAGASQIGNRESQMVIKPTVIVNVRGTVTHRDSDIRLESRKNEANNETKPEIPLTNVFNINQEIKLERTGGEGDKRSPNKVLQDIKIIENVQPRVEEDMMMCETGSVGREVRQERQYDSVLQILFNINNE